jgi:signal transduction histidine kinase
MEMLEDVRRQARFAALVLVPAAILVLTGLIDLLARRLVHRPLAEIHSTMRRAAAGDRLARAPAERNDELGDLAAGLNAMLERLGDFNAALEHEVQSATDALRDRHRQVLESNQRLFAARRELARSEQLALTGQMAASVAHQIGTPLNLISGYVQMILQELPAEAAAGARLRTVQAQIGKVTTIVQGLLDQARRPSLQRTKVEPSELVSGACELARPTLEAADIRLETRVDSELPLVDADVGQLEQAFLNLITNSIDAMAGGGTLTVSARRAGSVLEFEFADTGSGIAATDLPRVFDPLFTTKRPGKGTGLGLAIVRDVVTAHGGSVTLASTPGHGTCVTIRLPRAAVAQAAHA